MDAPQEYPIISYLVFFIVPLGMLQKVLTQPYCKLIQANQVYMLENAFSDVSAAFYLTLQIFLILEILPC